MAHTPAPWLWMNYPDGRKLLLANDRVVIHCPDAPIGCDPEDQSLIAAAPDLLAALHGLREAAKEMAIAVIMGKPLTSWEAAFNAAYDKATTTIAKAEGR